MVRLSIRGTCSYCRREVATYGHPEDAHVRLSRRHNEGWLDGINRPYRCPGSACAAILDSETREAVTRALRGSP